MCFVPLEMNSHEQFRAKAYGTWAASQALVAYA